jgi:hypothetical protein
MHSGGWLFGSGVWLGLTLLLGLVLTVLIDFVASLDEFDTDLHRTGLAAIRHFWGNAVVLYPIALAFLVPAIGIAAWLAAQEGAIP